MIRTSLIFPLLVLCGCTSHEVVRPEVVERIGVQEQALQEVAATPTTFTMPAADHFYAWERTQLFFREYTTGAQTKLSGKGRHPVVIVTKANSKDKYLYKVEKRATRGGYVWKVIAQPNSPAATEDAALRNARNVARFIRVGTLEVSLLDR